jgi:DNA-binding CsgD family transcriptional regulator
MRSSEPAGDIPLDAVALTAREYGLIECLSRGLSNKAIAAETGLTYGTVRIYMNIIARKLRVGQQYHSRIKLALDFLAGRFYLSGGHRGGRPSMLIRRPKAPPPRPVAERAVPVRTLPVWSPPMRRKRKLTAEEERWNATFERNHGAANNTPRGLGTTLGQ